MFATGVRFDKVKLKFAVCPVIKKTAELLYEQVATPDATVTLDTVSESFSMFAKPVQLNPVNAVVPFNKFETLVNVEYVLVAVALVR